MFPMCTEKNSPITVFGFIEEHEEIGRALIENNEQYDS